MRAGQCDRNQGDRLPVDLRADFDTARVEARTKELELFRALRGTDEVRYRTTQELAVLRQTLDRLRAHSDINDNPAEREQQMRLLLPGLLDLDRRTTLIQYNDALTDELLDTVEKYATFWASNADLANYLQRQQPPTLWQQLQLQERKIAAMLQEIRALLPQTSRVTEARTLEVKRQKKMLRPTKIRKIFTPPTLSRIVLKKL
jgi:neutral trehalase